MSSMDSWVYVTIYFQIFIANLGLLTFYNKYATFLDYKLAWENTNSLTLLDLRGFGIKGWTVVLVFTIIFFSFLGVPPLIGFFIKYNLLLSLVKQGWVLITVGVVILSVLSALVYLKLIKELNWNL
jgi:NADH:ubiquinone oxidoreductase subunit 2 (subunit N)